MPASLLVVEFAVLFVVLPLGVRFSPWPLPVLPLLWVAALYCWVVLRADPSFDRAQLWNPAGLGSQWPGVLGIFAILGTLIVLGVRLWVPQLLFGFVRSRPGLWAAVMVLYPVLSVYPQGLVYRAFLLHRYAPLVRGVASPELWLIFASAAALGFMHLIFRNPLAPAMTFLGGLLFAWRYQQTHSLLASSTEHALYGCLLFTAGLGQYFYHGRIRLQ